MKKMMTVLLALLLMLSASSAAYAAEGKVTYTGGAEKFIFAPGSDQSVTDLFPDFKGVMPGAELSQTITVKNDVSNGVKVRLYLRALGAQTNSEDFLSQLELKVEKTNTVLFDAAADETAQLSDWVYLGTLYSGGELDLTVTLSVPATLGNEYQNAAGYLDWEFRADQLPISPGDPPPPPVEDSADTGDSSRLGLWAASAVSAAVLTGFVILRRRREA